MKISRTTSRSRKLLVQDAEPRFYFDGQDFLVSSTALERLQHYHVAITPEELATLITATFSHRIYERLGDPQRAGQFIRDLQIVLAMTGGDDGVGA